MSSVYKPTIRGGELHEYERNLFGKDLIQAIVKDVKDTQQFAGINLPDRLLITQKQYLTIENDTTAIGETERLFVTPLNAMEVYVVDRNQKELDDLALTQEKEDEATD